MFKNNSVFSSYSVNDLDTSLNFYTAVLGLSVSKTKEGLNIKWSNGHSVFLYQKDDHTPATFTVLNFIVDDINESTDILKSKGILLERYDNTVMTADEKGIYRGKASGNGPDIAWFKDPASNILSIIQE